MTTTWSATDKNAHVALSNGALTAATDGTLNLHFAGRSSAAIGAGDRKFWELTITALDALHDAGVGIVNASETFGDDSFLGSQSNGIGYYDGDGSVFSAGGLIATMAAFGAGDIIGIACHGGSRLWLRVNGGFWNNFGTDDPAIDMGGFDISAMGVLFPAFNVRSGSQITANFGATAFAFAAPSGFTGFDSVPAPPVVVANVGGGFHHIGRYTRDELEGEEEEPEYTTATTEQLPVKPPSRKMRKRLAAAKKQPAPPPVDDEEEEAMMIGLAA